MTLICGSSHFSVNACLAPICSLHHVAVTTVEGIGNAQKLHPVQVSVVVNVKPEHLTGRPQPSLQLCSGLLAETSLLEQRRLILGSLQTQGSPSPGLGTTKSAENPEAYLHQTRKGREGHLALEYGLTTTVSRIPDYKPRYPLWVGY